MLYKKGVKENIFESTYVNVYIIIINSKGESEMFNAGDLIIYSAQGICRIDNICEKTYFGVTKKYYTLHPLENSTLVINTPVDNDKVIMLELLSREEAEKILESFKLPGAAWIEIHNERNQIYSDAVKRGNRKEISMIANTLMREKIKAVKDGRNLLEKDKKLLTSIENILFAELALSLNTTSEKIQEKIIKYVTESEC